MANAHSIRRYPERFRLNIARSDRSIASRAMHIKPKANGVAYTLEKFPFPTLQSEAQIEYLPKRPNTASRRRPNTAQVRATFEGLILSSNNRKRPDSSYKKVTVNSLLSIDLLN